MENFDVMDIQGQQEAQDAAAEQQRAAASEADDDFKWLMSTKKGRRIVWRMLDAAGVFHSSFSPDAMLMAFNEGRRAAGLQILQQIHSLCPEHYLTMTKEQKQ